MINTINKGEGKFKGNNCQEMKKQKGSGIEFVRDQSCEDLRVLTWNKQTDRYFSSKDGCIQNQCVCVCVCVLVAQSCLTLCDPMNCSPTDFSIHRILQAKILEWEVFLCSRESSRFRDRIQISCNVGGLSNHLSHQGSPIQNQPRIANQSLQVLSSQRNKTSLKGKGQLGGL